MAPAVESTSILVHGNISQAQRHIVQGTKKKNFQSKIIAECKYVPNYLSAVQSSVAKKIPQKKGFTGNCAVCKDKKKGNSNNCNFLEIKRGSNHEESWEIASYRLLFFVVFRCFRIK